MTIRFFLRNALCALSLAWMHPLALATEGVIAAAQPDAVKAGLEILANGGNAVDAAIATSLALSVVEPSMSGLGGRSMALVRTSTGEIFGFNAMTEIPQTFVYDVSLPESGYATVATPGVVKLLSTLSEQFSRSSRSELVKPAIRLASEGFKLLPGEATRHESLQAVLAADPGMRQSFIGKGGLTHAPNALLKQPTLGETLQRLGEAGFEAFYSGSVAEQISKGIIQGGGYVELSDLENYRVLPARMISLSYRDHTFHAIAAPGGGGLVLKALNILNQLPLSEYSESQWAPIVSQAIGLALNTMTTDYEEKEISMHLSRSWAEVQAKKIVIPSAEPYVISLAQQKRASEMPDWIGEADAHTTHFVTADCNGTWVSITQTLGPSFGARVANPDLGFAYAATMGNYLRTGKQSPGYRPRTSIAPLLAFKDGQPVFSMGAAGGIRIPSALVQVISRIVDRGESLVEAIKAPRIHPLSSINEKNERVIDFMGFEAEITSEGWQEAQIDAWMESGFTVKRENRSARFARIHAIEFKDQRLNGVADPDWEGTASPAVGCRSRAATSMLTKR